MREDEEEYITLSLSSKEEDIDIKLFVLKSNIEELISRYQNKVVEINSFFNVSDNKIRNIIHELGIPSNIKGYNYLIDSIKITISSNVGNTNDIYLEISEKYKVSINSVEHAIRRAIIISFDLGNISLLHKIFGYSIKDIPTNTQYILMVSEYISLQLS